MSVDECEDFYESLPLTDPACLDRDNGVAYAVQGNTTLCRFLHHFMMKSSPEMHCYHCGKGRPDVNHKIKCGPDDCDKTIGNVGESEGDYSYLLSGSSPLTCLDPPTQFSFQERFISVLPYCIEALKTQTCTSECSRALRQFGLAGDEKREKTRAAQACACRPSIVESVSGGADSPQQSSVVLNVTRIDVGVLLHICGEKVGGSDVLESSEEMCGAVTLPTQCPMEEFPTVDGGCLNVDSHISEAAPEIFREISRRYGSLVSDSDIGDDPQSSNLTATLHRIDLEAARVLGGAYAATDTDRTMSKLLKDAFGEFDGVDAVPFLGGPILVSHAAVREILEQPLQGRSGNSFFWQDDVIADVWSIHGTT